MGRFAAAFAALVAVGVAATGSGDRPARTVLADSAQMVEVTSAADLASPLCPDPSRCTLRRAIEVVNADGPDVPFTITFKASVFPSEDPATIVLQGEPLPAITRARVTIDATGRGVQLDGSHLGTRIVDGLVLAGNEDAVRGLAIHHFSGACLELAGASTAAGGPGPGNSLGNCQVGIAVAGPASTVAGNRIGFAATGEEPASVDTGIMVTAANVTIGGAAPGLGNVVGNAAVAVQVGAGSGASFAGVKIQHNTLGRAVSGAAAPAGTAIDLRQPGRGTLVEENTIANTSVAGVRVAADDGGVSVAANTFRNNRFEAVGGLAIDLGGDGIRNPGGDHGGANGAVTYPVVLRAVQARITGSACAGCAVSLHSATHTPGGASDYGAAPLPGLVTTADAFGNFAFDNPSVTPGQWVIALGTDADGNTSEFGLPARVGSGVVQCANAALQPGWNLAGFFGSSPAVLGAAYPAGTNGTGPVSAIYQLIDGTAEFTHWFSANSGPRTLFTLTPGDAYWFYAEEPVSTGGGFTLSVPVPVQLVPGWNEFVYIGATSDVRDALSSIAGKYTDVYRFVNDGTASGWKGFGAVDTPEWARGFTTMEACGSYQVFVTEATTLMPLQP